MTTENYRLSKTIHPLHYKLHIAPNLKDATFRGSLEIKCEAAEAFSSIRINAIELIIETATITDPSGTYNANITYDTENEMANLDLEQELPSGAFAIAMNFTGILNDRLAGFYKSTYRNDEDQIVEIATTQFEATDARRAFPCFDEPEMKAIFEISLEVEPEHIAISNGAEVSSVMLASGKKLVNFEPTIPISSYLVAFVVGPLEATTPREVRGIPIRIIHRPGWSHLTTFAVEAAAHAVEFFSDFFGIAYPASKLDLIAIPDFAFGAMENIGAVTFRESLLIVDSANASQPEKERIVDVISHEIAHMWFGDLVTMKWWNGIWLNEAFATYMETLCTDHFDPAWKKWNTFGIYRSTAQTTDSLHATRPIEYPVAHPSDCQGMFDILTYEKGGSVLRMLERYLGTEPTRAGVSSYLRKYSYANAETTDLWDALEESTHAPVRSLMDSWVFQGGFPLVTLKKEGTDLIVEQEPFSFIPGKPEGSAIGEIWSVPLTFRNLDDSDELNTYLLDTTRAKIADSSSVPTIINAKGDGYYRVAYSQELIQEIIPQIHKLEELERFNLISDSWAQVVAAKIDYLGFLDVANALGGQGPFLESPVWAVVAQGLEVASKALGSEKSEWIGDIAGALFRPLLQVLGFNPADDEPETTGVLRSQIISVLGTLVKDPEVIEFAQSTFRSEMSGEATMEPSLAQSILRIIAANGDEADYAFVLDKYRHPSDPIEEQRYLSALSEFTELPLIERTLGMSLSEIRSQDAPFTISKMLAGATSGPIAFDFVANNYEALASRFPESTISRMIEGMAVLYSPEISNRANEVRNFLANVRIPETGKKLLQIRERFEANLALSNRLRSQL